MKNKTIHLVIPLLVLMLIVGNINSYAATYTDTCCIVKTKLVDKYGAKVAIKIPSPQFWAMADYEINHSLYLELNPVLNNLSTDQLLNSDEVMHQQFEENLSISSPSFSDADDHMKAVFTAANELLINSIDGDVTINDLFWIENCEIICESKICNNTLNGLVPNISTPVKAAWNLADETINTQLYTTTIAAQSSL